MGGRMVSVALASLLVACATSPGDTGPARSMRYVGDPAVVGALEGPEVDRVLAEVSEDLGGCLGEGSQGKDFVTWLEVDEEGMVVGISPGVGDELPVTVALCLHEVVGELVFPEPEGGMALVAVELRP